MQERVILHGQTTWPRGEFIDFMKAKLFCIIYLATIWTAACNGQTADATGSRTNPGVNKFSFVEKHDLELGAIHAAAMLKLETPVIKAGERISIKLRFVNTGHSWDFYNLFLNSRIPQPAQIALYDSNHNYLFEIIPRTSSVIGMSWDDWTYLPGGGCSVEFPMEWDTSFYRRLLPPGDYYLQLIYYKAFVALDPPWRDTAPDVNAKRERLRDFENHFDHSELFRSNPVEITITN